MTVAYQPLTILLIEWFKSHARDLPWRKNRFPWGVIVSEIMLQQTQVSTVLAYFDKWMKRFPYPDDLAQAQESEMLKMWEGLGYYRRARSLFKIATYIQANQGIIPECEIELQKIPGIGPYTSAAIVAFAFQKRAAPVDGNVARVMSRYLGYRGNINKASSLQFLRKITLELLPQEESWIAAEALIELGAKICKPKNPLCNQCPLKKDCYSNLHQCQDQIPIKSTSIPSEELFRSVALVHYRSDHFNGWLVRKKTAPGVFQGLWQFPFRELTDPMIDSEVEHLEWQKLLNQKLLFKKALKKEKHTFTRFKANLWPLLFSSSSPFLVDQSDHWLYQWVDMKDLKSLTFCSGHRLIAGYLEQLTY
jgi:A/G-specific adenine glycosylase